MIDCLFISILFLPADFFLGPGAGRADSTESRVEQRVSFGRHSELFEQKASDTDKRIQNLCTI